jgi:lysyl endopeptidase
MRRTVGIVVGVAAALTLAGASGAVAWHHVARPGVVGTWHDPADDARTPVSVTRVVPVSHDEAVSDPRPAASPAEASPARTVRPESAAAAGRQRVGTLVGVGRILGYARGPQRETFRYPGASYVKLHFDRLALLPGDYLTVSDPAGAESYRYEAPRALNTGVVDKWAMSITGDAAVLEVHRVGGDTLNLGALLGTLGVGVDRAARGFSRSEQARVPHPQLEGPGQTGREESVCGADESHDAVCYRSADPVAYTRSKAIARLLINGTELCTGWRVGRNDRMLTNNHCFTTSADAYDTEVWFNYQCARCAGYDVYRPTKVWGDRVLATDHRYDFTLFTVDEFAKIRPFGYLNLDLARPARGQELYIAEHPAGEPMRIAGALGEKAGTCAVVDNAYDGYAPNSDVAYYCDTAGGSSGSPVLSRATNKVVALHHFGGCPNSGVRADLLYSKIHSLL